MALTDVKSEQIQSSVALAGSPTTTTQSASDNSTKIATTAYVETAVANLVASAPAALNTLDELAAALNDDASFSTTITNSIAAKLPLAGGTLTGNVFSGNKTGLTDTNTGHAIAPGGLVYHATDGTITQSLHRLTDDGPVLRLVSNGTTAGSVGVLNGGLSFGSGSSMTTRMSLDTNGNFLVGTTDVSQYNNTSGANHGTVIGASSFIDISRNGNPMLYLNRTNSDGQLAYFSREGSGKGALSTRSGYIWLETVTSDGSDTSGVVLDGGAGAGSTSRGALIAAYGNENGSYPGQINLQPGASGKIQTYYGANATVGAAFNSIGNLTFPSGKGIDFSATAVGASTANQSELFHDYEEGNWTPTVYVGSTQQTIVVNRSTYVKIGDLVHCTFSFYASGSNFGSSGGNVELRGFPFSSSSTAEESCGSLMMNIANWNGAQHTWYVIYKYSGEANDGALFYGSGDAVGWDALGANQVPQNTSFIGTITFRVFT